jgi:hypothetical protein
MRKLKRLNEVYMREVTKSKIKTIKDEDLNSYITYKYIDETSKNCKIYINGSKVSLVNNNYTILEYSPIDELYNVRVFIDDKKNILLYYFDVINKSIFKDNEVYYVNSIKIITKFEVTSTFIVDITLNNSLIKVRVDDEDSGKILIDEEKSYNYVSIPKVLNYLDKSDNYIRYTNNVTQLLKDPKMCITTDCISYHNGEIYSFLVEDFDIKRNPHLLDKIQYGIYQNNLYLFQWNDQNEFCTVCLSSINKYGNPKVIAKSTDESIKAMKDYSIEIVGYKYILLKHNKTGKKGVFSIPENFIIPVETNLGAIIDPMDNDGDIIYVNYDEILTKSIKSPKINQEMCGIFLDVRKKSRDYYLYNKIGSWFIFKSTINNLTIYSNINGTLTISGEIESTPVIINDRCILIQTDQECRFFFFNGTTHKCALKNNNWNDEVIIVPNKNGKIHQLIEGFRHSPIGNSLDIPKIVCSAFGILYYIENNKFKHL